MKRELKDLPSSLKGVFLAHLNLMKRELKGKERTSHPQGSCPSESHEERIERIAVLAKPYWQCYYMNLMKRELKGKSRRG